MKSSIIGLLCLLLPVLAAAQDWTEHAVTDSFAGVTSVFAADVDGDGDIDLLGAAVTADSIAWWENTDGTGSAWIEHAVDGLYNGAHSVYATDMDNDGDTDILGVARSADDVTWWENSDGTGTQWLTHTVADNYDGATSAFATDVDGDGDIDVIGSAYDADQYTWWENLDGGGIDWVEHTVAEQVDGARYVHAADFDGDGDTDIVGVAYIDEEISWWENDGGAGLVWIEHTIASAIDGAHSVFAADVDGDGDSDVIGTAFTDDWVIWWENLDGTGTSWSADIVSYNYDGARYAYASDMDGDGDIDIVGAAQRDNEITWWENNGGGGTSWSQHIMSADFTNAMSACAADVNGDGNTDVIGAGGDSIAWWGAPATWSEYPVVNDFNGAECVYATDIDGDGDNDVLGASFYDDEITWWENADGIGVQWTEHVLTASFLGAASVFATDIDADGDQDVLGAAGWIDTIALWKNVDGSGGTWTLYTVGSGFSGAASVHAADVDGDGDIDVLGAGTDLGLGEIAWWENTDGTGTDWTEHTVDGSFNGALSVFGEDIDGDGDIDVVGAAQFAADITWWENTTGTGTSWTEHRIRDGFWEANCVHAADVDGDGDMDVLATARLLGDIIWWENLDGAGTQWDQHVLDGSFAGAHGVYATDLDGDGDTDVLGAAESADEIAWWENIDGVGTSWRKLAMDYSFDGAQSVYAADMDGDGDADVLGAAYFDDDISWWEQPGEPDPDPVVVTLTPTSSTEIPAAGGTLAFDAIVVSNLPGTYPDVYFWTKVKLPNGNFYPQIQFLRQFTLQPFMNVSGSLTQDIPVYAPPGSYEMWGWIGTNPTGGGIEYGDFFPFTKSAIPGTRSEVPDWAAAGEFAADDAAATGEVLPSQVVLGAAHPNPFNSSTTLSIHLPEAARISVVVFNVMGQRVVTLAKGSFEAGAHTLTFDATNLTSGLYFVRASVPGQLEQVRKVMLVR